MLRPSLQNLLQDDFGFFMSSYGTQHLGSFRTRCRSFTSEDPFLIEGGQCLTVHSFLLVGPAQHGVSGNPAVFTPIVQALGDGPRSLDELFRLPNATRWRPRHILLLLLHFSTAVSRLTDQSKVLAQRLALMEQRQKELEKRLEDAGEDVPLPELIEEPERNERNIEERRMFRSLPR